MLQNTKSNNLQGLSGISTVTSSQSLAATDTVSTNKATGDTLVEPGPGSSVVHQT